MKNTTTIAWKEIKIYFVSPMAYIIMAVYSALAAYYFVTSVSGILPEATIRGFIFPSTLIFTLLAPILTMRLLSEEQKLGTLELLMTSPVRDWEVIVGKYLASLVFFLVLVILSLFYTILLFVFANPDPGPIYTGYLGLILYGAAALAIGLLTSTLTSNQIVAAVVAMGILLALYFAHLAFDSVGGLGGEIIGQLGLKGHFDDSFQKGVIDTKSIVYFVSVIFFFLFLSVRVLDSRRWR